MKLLPLIQLTSTALTAAWPQFAWIPEKTTLQSNANVHLLRNCHPKCPRPITCRSHGSVSSSPPTTTVLLLNFTLNFVVLDSIRLFDALDLWITCSPGFSTDLKLIIHHHHPRVGDKIKWIPSIRGCRRPPTIVFSTSDQEMSRRQWTIEEVSAHTQAVLRSPRAMEVQAKDEHGPSSPVSSSHCLTNGASVFSPREWLEVQSQNSQDIPVSRVLGVHLKQLGRTPLKQNIRVDLIPPQTRFLSTPVVCIITSNGSASSQLSIGAPPGAVSNRGRVIILSNHPVILDASIYSSLNVSVRDRLTSVQLADHLTSLEEPRFRRQLRTFVLPNPGSESPKIILRLNLSQACCHGSEAPLQIPLRLPQRSGTEDSLSKIIVRTTCGRDGTMEVEADAVLARAMGVSVNQLAFKSFRCQLKAVRGSLQRWRLKFLASDCGSWQIRDPNSGKIIFVNKVIVNRDHGAPVFLKTIQCPAVAGEEEKNSTNNSLSYYPEPGRRLLISYVSDSYDDFHVLACGVDGSRIPIYNIFFENRSVDNQLLHFEVLPRRRSNFQEFALRFKRDYPLRENPFNVNCLIEGCKRSSIRQPSIGGLILCASGERTFRSKVLLAHVRVKWPSHVKSGQSRHRRLSLIHSICIWSTAFVLGIIFMVFILLIHHRTRSRTIDGRAECVSDSHFDLIEEVPSTTRAII